MAYLRYWLKHASRRADFLSHLQMIFPNFEGNQLLNILSVTAEGSIAGTPEQEQFIERYGQALLLQVLAKFRDFPTDPRAWEKIRSRAQKHKLFFKKGSLQTILEEAGSQNVDSETLKVFDRVLVEFANALVEEALRLMRYSQPMRKTFQGKDIELAISLKQEEKIRDTAFQQHH